MTAPNVSVKILAENLAHAALEQTRRDLGRVKDAADQVSGATRRSGRSFGDLVRGHLAISSSAKDARKGINALEDGMRAVALRATGLQGPIGQLSKGLLLLGGGGGAVLATAAAIGALALAYNHINKPITDAIASAKEYTETLNKQADAAKSSSERLGEMLSTLNRAKQQPLFAPGREPISIPLSMAGQHILAPPSAAPGQGLDQLDVMRVLSVLAFGRAENADARREREREAAKLAEEDRKALLEAAAARAMDREAMIKFIRQSMDANMARTIPIDRDRLNALARANPAPPPTRLSEVAGREEQIAGAIGAIGDLAMASSHGVGGLLNFAGGALSSGVKLGSRTLLAANPILGSLLSFGGGIFQLFDRSAERRHKELMQQLRDLRPLAQQARVTLNVVSATTGEIVKQTVYEAGRREDRDAVERRAPV